MNRHNVQVGYIEEKYAVHKHIKHIGKLQGIIIFIRGIDRCIYICNATTTFNTVYKIKKTIKFVLVNKYLKK